MTVFLLESYVKSLTSKTDGIPTQVRAQFETYVKLLSSKPFQNDEGLESAA